jgi:hypothetical protein
VRARCRPGPGDGDVARHHICGLFRSTRWTRTCTCPLSVRFTMTPTRGRACDLGRVRGPKVDLVGSIADSAQGGGVVGVRIVQQTRVEGWGGGGCSAREFSVMRSISRPYSFPFRGMVPPTCCSPPPLSRGRPCFLQK